MRSGSRGTTFTHTHSTCSRFPSQGRRIVLHHERRILQHEYSLLGSQSETAPVHPTCRICATCGGENRTDTRRGQLLHTYGQYQECTLRFHERPLGRYRLRHGKHPACHFTGCTRVARRTASRLASWTTYTSLLPGAWPSAGATSTCGSALPGRQRPQGIEFELPNQSEPNLSHRSNSLPEV